MAMFIRLLIILTALTSILSAAPSQKTAMRELRKNSAYLEGIKAMEGSLPDIAINNFRSVLKDEQLGNDAKAYTSLVLAEALVRTSLTPQGKQTQAAEALDILDRKELANIPSTPIWKAEALAAAGRYQRAEEALAKINNTHPLFSQTQLARARIQIALNNTDQAIATLSSLTSAKPQKIRNTATLLVAEMQIGQGRFELASKFLNEIDSENPTAARIKDYLQARLLLNDGKSGEAINQFQSLITAPEYLSERILRASVLGLADALAANENNDAAIGVLLDYISEHIDSRFTHPFFTRLIQLLPDEVPLDHPAMQKLQQWSDQPIIHDHSLIPEGVSVAALPVQTSSAQSSDMRSTQALYYRAKLLARSSNSDHHSLALALLARLRALHPSLPSLSNELYLKLSSASLLDTAYLHLQQNRQDQATYTLEVIEEIAFSPELKDQANFLRGELLAKDMKYTEALAAFNFARLSSSPDIANAASINAGIMSLLSSNLTVFEKIAESHKEQKLIRTALVLERALWKCSTSKISGRNDLESFIIAYPGHPREDEARLALASACVDIAPPDLILAKAQLEIVSSRLTSELEQFSITNIGIRAEELSKNWKQAGQIAQSFITNFPESSYLPAVMLKQGEALYHNEDYNASRRVFQDVSNNYPDSPFIPYADFYAAMAARLGGTTQSREESIGLFQKIIDSEYDLSSEARIQQSRVLIDLRRYEEAQKSLTPLKKSELASIRRDSGILLADCLHRQGAADNKKYQEAIAIYNTLLEEKDLPRAWNHRIHFLRGQTYESMNGQRSNALDSYLDVILRAAANPIHSNQIEEWLWFYRCGFKALSMLESDQRWEAAVKLARQIASFKGPRAEEATKRATNLANTHMIWEE